MRAPGWLVVPMAAAVLAACGSQEPAQPAAQPASAAARGNPSATAPADATAAEVAAEARGKLKCPPKMQTAPRAAKAPVDDVLGVRPGMTYDEAAALVMCTHDLMIVQTDPRGRFQIQTYGQSLRWGFGGRFAEPRVTVQKTARDYRREMQDRAIAVGTNRARRDIEPGQAKWYVATIGLPGEERVISAAREEWFEEGRNPTVASVAQALIKKYGTPTEGVNQARNRTTTHYMRWAYDPFGRLITETSPLFRACHGTADPNGPANYSPDCGIVVMARIEALRENPELSQYMQVGVIDQAGGYEAIERTEQALQEMETQRRAKQVQEAQKNADAPSL